MLATERYRQGQLDQEAQALNSQSQDRYVGFEDKQAERAGELGDYFVSQQIEGGDANAAAAQAAVAPQSGSAITVREEAKQRGKAREFKDEQGRRLGNLRSFGDLVGEIGRAQARDVSEIGQITGSSVAGRTCCRSNSRVRIKPAEACRRLAIS